MLYQAGDSTENKHIDKACIRQKTVTRARNYVTQKYVTDTGIIVTVLTFKRRRADCFIYRLISYRAVNTLSRL
jgi:hypothetical protein